jgi:hypothetical protein
VICQSRSVFELGTCSFHAVSATFDQRNSAFNQKNSRRKQSKRGNFLTDPERKAALGLRETQSGVWEKSSDESSPEQALFSNLGGGSIFSGFSVLNCPNFSSF